MRCERKVEGAQCLRYIEMKMRGLCSVLEMNSLLALVKATQATLPSTRNDLITTMKAWWCNHSYNLTRCWTVSVIVSISLSRSSLSHPCIALNIISTAFVYCAHLPSQAAECVRQALHPFQHAVQFMRLLLEELYSLHFHPEHCTHSGLQSWKLSWETCSQHLNF